MVYYGAKRNFYGKSLNKTADPGHITMDLPQGYVKLYITLRVISCDGAAYRDQMNRDEKGKPKERYPVVTLVLYFGYQKHWDKPLNLKERFDIPKDLDPYINDYHVNLFEIAWLPDETIAMFKSDFRFVADYFSQRWKNRQYKAPEGELRRVSKMTTFG